MYYGALVIKYWSRLFIQDISAATSSFPASVDFERCLPISVQMTSIVQISIFVRALIFLTMRIYSAVNVTLLERLAKPNLISISISRPQTESVHYTSCVDSGSVKQ